MNGRSMVLHITPWERSALQLLADGEAISDDVHLEALFARMGVANRAEAIVVASRRGLLCLRSEITEETAAHGATALTEDERK